MKIPGDGGVGGFAEERGESVDEAGIVCGGPRPPVRHLDAVAVARLDVVRPGIDDDGEAALPLPAQAGDLVHVAVGQRQPAATPRRHDLGIQRPTRPLTPVGPCGAERRLEVQVVGQPEGREIAEDELPDIEPVTQRRHADAAIGLDAIDIGFVVDIGHVDEDVDLGRLDAQPFMGRTELAVVDQRAARRDSEIPQRPAVLGRIARHQSDKALLVAGADALGERIADHEDGGPALLVFAGRARSGPEAVPVGLKVIDDVAPGPLGRDIGCQVMMQRRRDVGLRIGRCGVRPVSLQV